MRCLSCNKILTDFEATRKYANSNSYLDLCNSCLSGSDMGTISLIEREDLRTEEVLDNEGDEYDLSEDQ